MRVLKHLMFFLACTAATLLPGYWGAVLSLSNFAVGGDVTISEAQNRDAAIGDRMLMVFDWPSQHLIDAQRSWFFSPLFYGTILYVTIIFGYKSAQIIMQGSRKRAPRG